MIKIKKKEIYDRQFYEEIKSFPTYEEIQKNCQEKMIKKNGIHISNIESIGGRILNKNEIIENEKEDNILWTDYAITEKELILPLYGLTLKRIEFLVIWKDYNYDKDKKFTKILDETIFNINKNLKINVYIKNRAEAALELIKRKKYNKIILISDIRLDLKRKHF